MEEGKVISQNPSAGTKVEKGSKVSYVISKGKETVHVGDYSGYTKEKFQSKLEGKGLKVSYTDSQYDSTVPEGCVITHSPKNEYVSRTLLLRLH